MYADATKPPKKLYTMKAAVMAKTTSFGDTAWPPVATEIALPAPFSMAPWLNTKYAMAKSVYTIASRRPYRSSTISPIVVRSLRRYQGASSQ